MNFKQARCDTPKVCSKKNLTQLFFFSIQLFTVLQQQQHSKHTPMLKFLANTKKTKNSSSNNNTKVDLGSP